jgi:hypothetical protein
MYDKARHECAVRYLCALRHKKGLTWFRNYISTNPKVHEFLIDYQQQYALGNRGEWGKWILKNTLSQQRGLDI